MRIGALTDRGQVRGNNEDAFRFGPVDLAGAPGAWLALVADGMGGHEGGEVASLTAVEAFWAEMAASGCPGPWEDRLIRAVQAANMAIAHRAAANPSLAGMGTTLTAAWLEPDLFTIVHVGDSRAYLWRGGRLQRLTVDHSVAEELVQGGHLDREQARFHPQRHVLTRALGTGEHQAVDLVRGNLCPGDTILLCTDGLSGTLSDPELAALLATGRALPDGGPDQIASILVAAANSRGGNDNITVVVIEV